MLRIGTLWLVGLTAALAAGCVDNEVEESAFVARWALANPPDPPQKASTLDVPPPQIECEDAGAKTVVLEMRNQASQVTFTDSWPCDAKVGRTQVLPSGTYDALLSLRDNAGTVLSQQTGTFQILRSGLTDSNETVYFLIQSFKVSWVIQKAGAPSTCAAVGGTTVELVAQLQNGAPLKYQWPCSDSMGETTAILTGVYALQLRLLDPTGKELDDKDKRPVIALTVDGESRAVVSTNPNLRTPVLLSVP